MKKVLVLGGTRLFGKHLVKNLVEKNYDVTIATRGLAEDQFGDTVKRIVFDRYNEESIKANLSALSFDVVVDMLAYSSYDIEILLPNIQMEKYIVVSSTAVYDLLAGQVMEADFNPLTYQYSIDKRDHSDYARGKRLIEAAIVQKFSSVDTILVRVPFVVGEDDYTHRLKDYITTYINGEKLFSDNLYEPISFILSSDAGKFLSQLVECEGFSGVINGASSGEMSLYEILSLVDEQITKEKASLAFCDTNASVAPYNGIKSHSIDTSLAQSLGITFAAVTDWMPGLVKSLKSDI